MRGMRREKRVGRKNVNQSPEGADGECDLDSAMVLLYS